LFLSEGKHRCITPTLRFLIYNYYYYLVACDINIRESQEN
jgi:hypothetical protein